MGVQIGSIVLKRPWTPIFFLLSLMKLPNTLLSLSVHVLELEYASRGRTQTERCQAPLSEPPFSLKSWSRGSSPVSSNSCFCKIPSSFPNYSQYKLVHHSQKQMCQYTFNLHLSFYAWGWASFLIFKCCSCFPWNSFTSSYWCFSSLIYRHLLRVREFGLLPLSQSFLRPVLTYVSSSHFLLWCLASSSVRWVRGLDFHHTVSVSFWSSIPGLITSFCVDETKIKWEG